MRRLLSFIFAFCVTITHSQNDPRLQSRGKLPATVTGTANQKFIARKAELNKAGILLLPAEQKLLLSTCQITTSLVATGRVLVNDTLSTYANLVLDQLLKDAPLLRKQLSVYVYYSEGANVVTFYNGMILMEMGLIARLHNEAELAFILSHEVIHYQNRHHLKSFQYEVVHSANSSYNLESSNAFSRTLEQEADSVGLLLFLKSDYSTDAAFSAFSTLENEEQAICQIPFTPSFFEHGKFTFPDDYYLQEKLEITKDTTEVTHPSWAKRNNMLQRMLKEKEKTGSGFIVSESSFRFLKKAVMHECSILYLEHRDYVNAIYLSYCILSEDSTDISACQIVGEGLYGLALTRLSDPPVQNPEFLILANDKNGDFIFPGAPDYSPPTWTKIDGESQSLYFFLSQLNLAEISALSFDWNWQVLRKSNFSDSLSTELSVYSFYILNKYTRFTPSDLNDDLFLKLDTTLNDTAAKKAPAPTTTNKNAEFFRENQFWKNKIASKEKTTFSLDSSRTSSSQPGWDKKMNIDLIKQNKTKAVPAYVYYAFQSYYKDTSFLLLSDKSIHSHFDILDETNLADRTKKDSYSSNGLEITTVIAGYSGGMRLEEYKRTETFREDVGNSAILSARVNSTRYNAAQTEKIKLVQFDPATMDSSDLESYKTFCMIEQWQDERFTYGMNPLVTLLAHGNLADSIIQRTGTRYLMTSEVIRKHKKRVRNPGFYIACVIIPYTAPIAIIYGLIPNNISHYQATLFDVKTGKVLIYCEQIKKNRGSTLQLNQFYYLFFGKASHHKKKTVSR